MSYEISGKVIYVGNTVDVTDKFRKREFVISKSESVNGNTYTEEIKFQTVQNNCGILDKVSVGDDVDVKFNIKGKKWKEDWFTNLDAWKVELQGDSDDIPSANESILGSTPSSSDEPTETKRVVATATNDGEDFFEDDNEDLPF
jgi:hypothetical protein